MFRKNKTINPETSIQDSATKNSSIVFASHKSIETLSPSEKPTVISEGASFDGNIITPGSVHIEGKFKGAIKAEKVTISKLGNFNGKIDATILNVFGMLKGDASCESLTLSGDANISAKINYKSISVQPGAIVSGELVHKTSYSLKE
jgi:cytoskeletal protein CcmA (bactofilin family)